MTFLYRLIASFPNALNQAFGRIMPDKAFQKLVIKDAADYRKDMADDENMTDDDVLTRAFDEIYSAWMKDLEERGDYSENTVTLYRAISADNVYDIKLNKLGVYWTWDEKKATNYSDRNTKKVLYTVKAEVPIDTVNLKRTLQKIVWPGYDFEENEREFELQRGSSITIKAITDKAGKNYLKKEQKGTV